MNLPRSLEISFISTKTKISASLFIIHLFLSSSTIATDLDQNHVQQLSLFAQLNQGNQYHERLDMSWLSMGVGGATGKHSGPWVLLASSYLLDAQKYGTTRFIWSLDLTKTTQEEESFTYIEFGQLFGRRHQLKGDDIFWAIGPALVIGDDKLNDQLDFKTIGLAWEIEAQLAQFSVLGGSAKLAGNLNRQHSLIGISFHFNLGNFNKNATDSRNGKRQLNDQKVNLGY